MMTERFRNNTTSCKVRREVTHSDGGTWRNNLASLCGVFVCTTVLRIVRNVRTSRSKLNQVIVDVESLRFVVKATKAQRAHQAH
ncbi:hypothetical protein ALC60_08676 [Trachymyrmex zeteki]|uniref:Uncharacterized protein n=1 Tax=Mycetomoellerius zeteki TaxID=64791 RepID=A0A151WVY5_9HYME|nr:hypothetical protein ALC60_08676 [Trachymyrmex zeteki]